MDLDGYDVVAWTLGKSCECTERSVLSYFMQGLNYCQRARMNRSSATYSDLDDLEARIDISSDLAKGLREIEEQRLNDLYAPFKTKTGQRQRRRRHDTQCY